MTIEENGKTITLPESGAMCVHIRSLSRAPVRGCSLLTFEGDFPPSVEWILTRYGPQMLPAQTDIEASAQHMFYMHYAEVSLGGDRSSSSCSS